MVCSFMNGFVLVDNDAVSGGLYPFCKRCPVPFPINSEFLSKLFINSRLAAFQWPMSSLTTSLRAFLWLNMPFVASIHFHIFPTETWSHSTGQKKQKKKRIDSRALTGKQAASLLIWIVWTATLYSESENCNCLTGTSKALHSGSTVIQQSEFSKML